MNRTLRNGLAVAGMAGGMLFLGQAVAQADQHSAAEAETEVVQTSSAQGSGGEAENENESSNTAVASNSSEIDVETDVEGGDGGFNAATINTGVISDDGRNGLPAGSVEIASAGQNGTTEENGSTTVELDTGDVKVHQEANGGDVNGSGNVHVAGLPDQTATANATTTVDQTATVEDGDSKKARGSGEAENENESSNTAVAANSSEIDIETDAEGGDGGTNVAAVNTGVITGGGGMGYSTRSDESSRDISVELDTGDVKVHQEANGGDVNGSGNVDLADLPDQTARANAETTVRQTATVEDGNRKKNRGSGEAENDNESDNTAVAANSFELDIETDAEGGDGGTNVAVVNTGLIGTTFNCPEGSTCHYDITTGDVYVHQEANGGDVNNSGNVNIGGHHDHDGTPGHHHDGTPGHHHDGTPGHHHDAKPAHHHDDCPKHEASAAQPTAKKAAVAPVSHRAAMKSSAQPKGQLAYTGSTGEETTLPLTLGLLALGMGGALTLAGRRRETTTV